MCVCVECEKCLDGIDCTYMHSNDVNWYDAHSIRILFDTELYIVDIAYSPFKFERTKNVLHVQSIS